MNFQRNEIWFRKVYQDDIENEAITIIFRPGDRTYNKKKEKCFKLEEELTLKVLKKPGDNEKGVEPEFIEGLTKMVRVKDIKKVVIDDLADKDFVGSYPDVKNREQLRYHLGKIYNNVPSYFKKVTKIKIEYLS